MTSVSLALIIKLSGAASSTLDYVIPSKGSLSHELLMACWTTLSHSSPARQGWLSLKQLMCLSSDPSTATVRAQLLNELIIIVLSKPSHDTGTHLTISLQGVARMFPTAAKEWVSQVSPAVHSSYFSVTFALKGLFQTTSGAWMYFVQPPGMIKGSIFDVRSSCLTVYITWHLNKLHAKIRRLNVNFPRTLYPVKGQFFVHPPI